ncbi:Phytanoyl-CoA dioxygenase peroxisomal [Penicillium subrubescens]|uniref:Phytanoyl-CoA dioxygenase peroxisomal n=1 Tax=Penicillium subrubescens TaxID=1316194 RepID=UPI0025456B38|nr:Phytanoyl-CoA dioxygenase peroxisomal [Penicillium subrubescens]KAJ5900634.1 Phytanoyl-CoA dioxygenase peroxisomal [Penicillium subrubescens]
MDDVLAGKETAREFPRIHPSFSASQRVAAFSRIHSAHRVHALHERFLQHPRILDVVEHLSGPDILALQSMVFFKEPGQPGQSLIAAWVAVSDATEENGCLLFRGGSQVEPTYPCTGNSFTQTANGLDGVFQNFTAPVLEPTDNQLTPVAERYPEIPCPAKPGDVVFFRGNIIHRSHANNSTTPQRAFVAHYCDARSVVPWNIGRGWERMDGGKCANDQHILARGDSHLPYAHPRFGTPIQRL